MGVVFAGFMKILLPLLVVIPGIVAFRLYPNLRGSRPGVPDFGARTRAGGLERHRDGRAGQRDALAHQLRSQLVQHGLHHGPLPAIVGPRSSRNGTWCSWGASSAFVILVVATLLAIWFSRRQQGVFLLIQNVGAWVAAPIAAVFLLGVLWKRTTAWAATFVLVFGFPYTWFVEYHPVQAC